MIMMVLYDMLYLILHLMPEPYMLPSCEFLTCLYVTLNVVFVEAVS